MSTHKEAAVKLADVAPALPHFEDEDDMAKLLADRLAAGDELAGAELASSHSAKLYHLVFGHLSSYGRMDLFRSLSLPDRLLTFRLLRPSEASLILEEASLTDAEAYIASLPAQERLDTLQTLSQGAVAKVVHVLKADEKAACDFVRCFPEGSVGRMMHRVPAGMALLGSLTVDKAAAAVTATDGPGADPRRTGGLLLIRDHDNKLLGWTDGPTLVKLAKGAHISTVRYYGLREEGAALHLEVGLGLDGHTHSVRVTEEPAPVSPMVAALASAARAAAATSSSVPADEWTTEHVPPILPVTDAAPPSAATASASTTTINPIHIPVDPSTRTLASIAYPLVHVLKTDDDADELLRLYSVADYTCIPVVDHQGVLQGVVRARDAIKVLNGKIATFTAADTGITSYSKSSVSLLVRKRIVWLLILAALNFGVAAVVGQFEEILSKNLVLAGFIPLLAGMGGNIGAQTTGLVISAVSSRDIARNDVWRVLRKEVWVGLWLSLILGLVAALMGYIRATEGSKGPVALTIGASMAVVSAIANLLGVFMPFGSLASGQDPAVSSSPLITTAIDVIGISLYLAVAQGILGAGAEGQ